MKKSVLNNQIKYQQRKITKDDEVNEKRKDSLAVIDLTINHIMDKLDEAINATYTLQKLPLFNIEYSVAIPYNVNHYNMKHYDSKDDEHYFKKSYKMLDHSEPIPNKYDLYDNDNNIKFTQRKQEYFEDQNIQIKNKIKKSIGKLQLLRKQSTRVFLLKNEQNSQSNSQAQNSLNSSLIQIDKSQVQEPEQDLQQKIDMNYVKNIIYNDNISDEKLEKLRFNAEQKKLEQLKNRKMKQRRGKFNNNHSYQENSNDLNFQNAQKGHIFENGNFLNCNVVNLDKLPTSGTYLQMNLIKEKIQSILKPNDIRSEQIFDFGEGVTAIQSEYLKKINTRKQRYQNFDVIKTINEIKEQQKLKKEEIAEKLKQDEILNKLKKQQNEKNQQADQMQQKNKQKEKKQDPEKTVLKQVESDQILNNEPPPLDQNKLLNYHNQKNQAIQNLIDQNFLKKLDTDSIQIPIKNQISINYGVTYTESDENSASSKRKIKMGGQSFLISPQRSKNKMTKQEYELKQQQQRQYFLMSNSSEQRKTSLFQEDNPQSKDTYLSQTHDEESIFLENSRIINQNLGQGKQIAHRSIIQTAGNPYSIGYFSQRKQMPELIFPSIANTVQTELSIQVKSQKNKTQRIIKNNKDRINYKSIYDGYDNQSNEILVTNEERNNYLSKDTFQKQLSTNSKQFIENKAITPHIIKTSLMSKTPRENNKSLFKPQNRLTTRKLDQSLNISNILQSQIKDRVYNHL